MFSSRLNVSKQLNNSPHSGRPWCELVGGFNALFPLATAPPSPATVDRDDVTGGDTGDFSSDDKGSNAESPPPWLAAEMEEERPMPLLLLMLLLRPLLPLLPLSPSTDNPRDESPFPAPKLPSSASDSNPTSSIEGRRAVGGLLQPLPRLWPTGKVEPDKWQHPAADTMPSTPRVEDADVVADIVGCVDGALISRLAGLCRKLGSAKVGRNRQ